MEIKFEVDPEFESFLSDLSEEEFKILEENLVKYGIRDPLVVWQGLLIDGHNRFKICNKHNLSFEVIEATGLKDRLDVKSWMINNQIGKRNLTTYQKSELALKMIEIESEKAKERQIRKPVDKSVPPDLVEQIREELPPDLVEDNEEDKRAGEALVLAAKKAGVGAETVRKVKKILESEDEDLIEKVKNNKISPDKAFRELKKIERNETFKTKEWPSGKFRVIYTDNPWQYGDKRPPNHGGAEEHYNTMSISELCNLPVADIADEDAVLFMWTTSPLLEDSFKVINAWGFKYKASFIWDKIKHNMGHYNSVRHEFLLIATKGSCVPDNPKLFDSVQVIERTDKHSEKPEEFRNIIDTLYQFGRKVELFARKKVENWEVWGNQIGDEE